MAKDKSTGAETPAPETISPPAPPPAADLGLAVENERLRAQVEGLTARSVELERAVAAERERGREELESLQRRFDNAWAEREARLEEQLREKVATPAPKRKVAANLIRCHTKAGAKLTLQAGQEIPADVDLAGLPADAVVEV
jgi:hypothetical protein